MWFVQIPFSRILRAITQHSVIDRWKMFGPNDFKNSEKIYFPRSFSSIVSLRKVSICEISEWYSSSGQNGKRPIGFPSIYYFFYFTHSTLLSEQLINYYLHFFIIILTRICCNYLSCFVHNNCTLPRNI